MKRAEYDWNQIVRYEASRTDQGVIIRICAARVDMRKGFDWTKFIYDGIILDGERKGEKISNIEERFLSKLP